MVDPTKPFLPQMPQRTSNADIRGKITTPSEGVAPPSAVGAGNFPPYQPRLKPVPVRESITNSIQELREKQSSGSPPPGPPNPPDPNIWTMADKAVLAICETLALLFGLPFGDDLYHGTPITGWHYFYLAVGLLFAGGGPMWPWIRTRKWVPKGFSAAISRAAADARVWLAVLLLLFIYGAGPELYHRATAPVAVTGAIRVMPIDTAPAQKSEPQQVVGANAPWLAVAFKEYGQARLVGPQSNPRILEYLHSVPGSENSTDKDDWASAFAEWCLNQVNINGPKSMKAKDWVTWGRGIKEPKPGAVAIFNFDGTEHVGFVLIDSGDDLIVLGGNQETRVEVRRYPKSKIINYRIPPAAN